MIFEIDNIELDYKGKPILTGIYLKAETGKISGILGTNGTGKSSLLKIIFGNLKPHHKLIRIDKRAYLSPLFTSGLVKYLPQQSILPNYLSLESAFNLYRVPWEGFTVVFPEFIECKTWNTRKLSGGQVRVVETYLTLKSTAKLLLLDEPFTHLLPLNIEKFQTLLQEEKKEKAIILTDHMYRHILEAADEIYLLKNGCSKYIDNPLELEDYHYLNPNTL